MNFRTYKLKDIGEVITGNTPSKSNSEFYDSKDVMFIKPDDLYIDRITMLNESKEYLSNKGAEHARILPQGSVLVTCIGIIGKVGILKQEMAAFNQQINAIIPDKNIVNEKYLAYKIWNDRKKLQHIANAPLVPIINKKQFSEFKIDIPSLDYQLKVVDVLDKAQELIDKRKAQIEALDQLTQSVFLEMFGDPWINPKKWRVKKIKEVIKNKPINGFFAKNEQYSDKGNAKIIWISDFINKRSANIHGLKKVVATEEDIKKYQVKYGDILFCRSSLNVDGIGKAAYVPEFPKDENIIFECHIIKITLSDEVLPEFFQVLSETKFFRNQIIKHSKTSTMTTISQSGIMECSIIVPPVQIQNQFLQILKKIEYEKQKLQNSLSLLNDNFNSLMQRAFKGELFNEQ